MDESISEILQCVCEFHKCTIERLDGDTTAIMPTCPFGVAEEEFKIIQSPSHAPLSKGNSDEKAEPQCKHMKVIDGETHCIKPICDTSIPADRCVDYEPEPSGQGA